MPEQLLVFTDSGIYCPKGDFYIDPWKPVKYAVITHAHSDHARWGSAFYLAHKHSLPVLKYRLGADIKAQAAAYNQPHFINGAKVSFHPAGHVLGSAQVRVEHKGEVWVVSGDYKLENDNVCEPFEPVKCNVFITESTFGLPIYKWQPQQEVFNQINKWWQENRDAGKASVIMGYALGKAQRIIQNIDHNIGPVYTHGAVENINEVFRKNGFPLKKTTYAAPDIAKSEFRGALILAPPSAADSPWMRKFAPYSTAIASGWMQVRGTRRRRAVDRGFVLSDHADWNELNTAVKATGAEKVYVTHGFTGVYARWLRENGFNAQEVHTQYGGELIDMEET